MNNNVSDTARAELLVKKFAATNGEDYASLAFVVAPNIVNGCSWGFLSDAEGRDLGFEVGDFKIPEGFQVFRLRTGYMVTTDYQTLVRKIHHEAKIISTEVIVNGAAHRQKSIDLLNKKLAKGGNTLNIGFYCVNDSHTVTIDAVVYPAFNVDLPTLASAASAHGYSFLLAGRKVAPSVVLQKPASFLRALTLAPSGNAIMVNLAR